MVVDYRWSTDSSTTFHSFSRLEETSSRLVPELVDYTRKSSRLQKSPFASKEAGTCEAELVD